MEESYLVDVGFGAATPRYPIPLSGETVNDIRASFHIENKAENHFDLIRNSKTAKRVLYRFNTEKKSLIDFHEGCVYNQVSKKSTFTHYDIVTRSTEHGQFTINDATLTKLEEDFRQKEVLSAEQKTRVLKELFNISI